MKKIFFVLLTIVVVIACSKTENPATIYLPLTKENIAGSYKITDLTFKFADTALEYSLYNVDTVFKSCKKDDIISFDTNYTYMYKDSGTICDTLNTTSIATYVLTGPNLISNIKTIEPNYSTYIVQSLSINQLILTRTFVIPFFGGTKQGNLKVTLTKQP